MRKVEVKDVLRARDMRVERQQMLLEKHGAAVISFTMNIAGEIKRDADIERAFFEGVRRVEKQLAWHGAGVLEKIQVLEFTGCEQMWAVEGDAGQIKKWMQAIEEADGIGRLFDIDVMDCSGEKLGREKPRRCLICDESARACGRMRRHSGEELYRRAGSIIREHFAAERAAEIAGCAQHALLQEAITGPKPGLVDRENSGAHADMDIFSFAASAAVLGSYFAACARAGMEGGDLETLRFLGRSAEEEMLCATGGVNTHKGAIFSLGILCCAAGMPGEMMENARRIAEPALRDLENMRPGCAKTGGETQYLALGLTGVRGEAAAGFPSVIDIALPTIKEGVEAGKSLNDAGCHALLKLMQKVQDSNVLRRCGSEGLRYMQRRAGELLEGGFCVEDLRAMNDDFVEKNISPGGCADLLAVAYFLYFMEKGNSEKGSC